MSHRPPDAIAHPMSATTPNPRPSHGNTRALRTGRGRIVSNAPTPVAMATPIRSREMPALYTHSTGAFGGNPNPATMFTIQPTIAAAVTPTSTQRLRLDGSANGAVVGGAAGDAGGGGGVTVMR